MNGLILAPFIWLVADTIPRGWMRVDPCATSSKTEDKFADYVLLDPTQLVYIANPPESPKDCVAISVVAGRRLFVHGTIDEIAAMRNKALREREQERKP